MSLNCIHTHNSNIHNQVKPSDTDGHNRQRNLRTDTIPTTSEPKPESRMKALRPRALAMPRRTAPCRMAGDYTASWPAQTALALTAIAISRIAEQRPRGHLQATVPFAVQPSRVPGAGRGLFAGAAVPGGTVLGTYPGRLIDKVSYLRKLSAAPNAAEYCWQLSDGRFVLDPTDSRGALLEPLPLFEQLPSVLSVLSAPTTLCLINEPPPGADVNVDTFEEGTVLTFATSRDVNEGEEFYLDYGQTYDRSGYR